LSNGEEKEEVKEGMRGEVPPPPPPPPPLRILNLRGGAPFFFFLFDPLDVFQKNLY
jgi:hypothetical protein